MRQTGSMLKAQPLPATSRRRVACALRHLLAGVDQLLPPGQRAGVRAGRPPAYASAP